jgi:peptidoglycan/xylan/chitin deacetylase (PgdA/CDA1 family)
LTQFTSAELNTELDKSIKEFKKLTNQNSTGFALPFGEYDLNVIAKLRLKEFNPVFTTSGQINDVDQNSFVLSRFNIKSNFTLSEFENLITLKPLALQKFKIKSELIDFYKKTPFYNTSKINI